MIRARYALLFALSICLALLGGSRITAASPSDSNAPTERWYEILRDGQKLGHSKVVWAPSTWEGRPTIHDTTVVSRRSVRTMFGIRDVFETETTIDLERDTDGTMWWMKVVDDEGEQVTVTETTWTGTGYEQVTKVTTQAGESEQHLVIPLETPVMTDGEALLGQRIREGKVEVGDRLKLRLLDVEARGAQVNEVEILARVTMQDHGAAAHDDGEPATIECFKVRERDPRSGWSSLMWIDDDGAFVRLTQEGGIAYRRVNRDAAEAKPAKAAEFSVVTPSTPPLERIMNADRLLLDLHLQGDPARPLPVLPTSPWSRTTAVEGSDDEGWVVKLQLDRHDVAGATTTLPVDPERFARELESTALMPCGHEKIQAVVEQVAGEETDARTVAERLARWVYGTLKKRSPSVAQASALEILEQGQGDCSEHALLYVTLCRAAGIPTRSCSGYVNIGAQWGAHAWAEVWLGGWVGADPTTGEVGTAARYVFFGYHDDPESHPGVVSARARGRMRFVATRIDEGDASYDLSEPEAWTKEDRENGRYVHVLAGLDLRDVPEDWVVHLGGPNRAFIRADDLRVDLRADADQGMGPEQIGGTEPIFAGARGRRLEIPDRGVAFVLHSRRRIVQIMVQSKQPAKKLEILERVLAPTFAQRALAWDAPAEKAPEAAPAK